jgi:hypothetical protein
MSITKVEITVQYYSHASMHFHDMVHTNKGTFCKISGSQNSKYKDVFWDDVLCSLFILMTGSKHLYNISELFTKQRNIPEDSQL